MKDKSQQLGKEKEKGEEYICASLAGGGWRRRGWRVLVGCLPHVIYHAGGSWGLSKLLGHERLRLLAGPAEPTELLARAL